MKAQQSHIELVNYLTNAGFEAKNFTYFGGVLKIDHVRVYIDNQTYMLEYHDRGWSVKVCETGKEGSRAGHIRTLRHEYNKNQLFYFWRFDQVMDILNGILKPTEDRIY